MSVTIRFDPNSLNIQAATIPDATPFNDGVMTKAQAEKVGDLPPPDSSSEATMILGNAVETVNVYMSSTGSDSNTGLSAASPLKTFGAVSRKFPVFNLDGRKLIINLADDAGGQAVYDQDLGIYLVGGVSVGGAGAAIRGPQMVPVPVSSPFGMASGGNTPILDSITPVQQLTVTVANGTTPALRTQFNFTSGAGWAVDDLAGRFFVRVKRAGILRYFELPISGNAANSLIVDTLGILGNLAATDTVEIVYPGAKIQSPTGFWDLSGDNCSPRASATPLGSGDPNFSLVCERVSFGGSLNGFGTSMKSLDRCAFINQVSPLIKNSSIPIQGGLFCMVNCALRNSNITLSGTDSVGNFPARSRKDNALEPSVPTPSVAVTGFGSIFQVGLNITQTGSQRMTSASGVTWDLPVSLWAATPIAGNGALMVMAGSIFEMRGNTPLIGASAVPGSFGIRARVAAQIRISAGFTGLTGPAGADLNLETGAAVAYGTGGGQFMEAAGINGNLYRGNLATGDSSRIFVAST